MNRLYANVMKEETRLAIVDETGDLQQIIYERLQLSNRVNHMYKGVVKNVLPGMSAARHWHRAKCVPKPTRTRETKKSTCRGSLISSSCEGCHAGKKRSCHY